MISTSTHLFLQTPPPPVNLFSSADNTTVLSPSSVKFRRSNSFTAAATCSVETETTTEFCYSPVTSPAASFYEVLGIHTAATIPEIKAAYRKLARISHPDVAAVKDTSADDFMKIHAAYCTLLDPEKRADYDLRLSRRLRRSISLYSGGCVPSMSGFNGYTTRNWETDQCW